jgi:hypothetical protein
MFQDVCFTRVFCHNAPRAPPPPHTHTHPGGWRQFIDAGNQRSSRFHCEIRAFKEAVHAPVAHLHGITQWVECRRWLGKMRLFFAAWHALQNGPELASSCTSSPSHTSTIGRTCNRTACHWHNTRLSLAQHEAVTCVYHQPSRSSRGSRWASPLTWCGYDHRGVCVVL